MKYEFKVMPIKGFVDEDEFKELEKMLNDGWEVVRADHNGDNRVIVYILKRAIKE